MALTVSTAASTEEVDKDKAQIQAISEMIAALEKSFDGVGEALLASGEDLHRDFEDLRSKYAALEETSGLELLVMESENRELEEKHRMADLEKVKISKKFAAMEMKYKFEVLNTHEVQEKCAALEVKVGSAEKEKKRAEEKCREVEEKHAFEVSEKAKIEKDHAFLWENYQWEKNEKVRIEERCNVVEKKHEVEVSERGRVEKKYAELEERHELERLERLNVEHEHRVAVEEKRRLEKKCGELEGRNEVLMLEKMNAEDECRGIEAKRRLEIEERRKVEKEYAELWEKHKLELLEKVKVEIKFKELEEKHRKVEREYTELGEKLDFDMLGRIKKEEECKEAEIMFKGLEEKHRKVEKEYKELGERLDLDMLEMMKMEKECKEVTEKYRLEVKEKRNVEKKYDALVEKYRDVIMEILKEYNEIQEKHKFEQQEKLKIKRECQELEEKIEGLLRAQESKEGEEKDLFDKKYAVIQEKYEFQMLENLKMQNEYKELMEVHRLELIAKIKAENELNECQARLEGLKDEQIVASERYDRLLEEVRRRKAADKEVNFEYQSQNNKLESQNRMRKETFKLQHSGSDRLMNAKSLDSRNKEKGSENGGMTDDRSYKNPSESPDHVIDLEDIPDFMPASEVSPLDGGLHTSGTPIFSSGCSILISDSDDDCAYGQKKQMGLKRKRDPYPNTRNSDCGDNLKKDNIPIAEVMHHQKLRRCDLLVNYPSETVVASSAVKDYGKQTTSSSHGHINLGTIEKTRGTQKSRIESPAMASKEPFDCESDDDSTSIFSSDDSEDEDGLQSMFSAVVEKDKA